MKFADLGIPEPTDDLPVLLVTVKHQGAVLVVPVLVSSLALSPECPPALREMLGDHLISAVQAARVQADRRNLDLAGSGSGSPAPVAGP